MTILTTFSTPPPFTVWHSHPNQKSQVLITAGVDGDEYAGIEAVQKLIRKYSQTPPPIPITVIPIVNVAGYQQGVSKNPLDGRLPKTIFPGHAFGTSSSRLMHELSAHTHGIKLWIDLHSGAHDEHLPTPFVWADQTGNPNVDTLTSHLISSLSTTTLYSRHSLTPSLYLANRNISYLVFEAGELGLAAPKMINQHISWVTACISNLPRIHNTYPTIHNFTPTYTTIHYHSGSTPKKLPNNLLWFSPSYYVTGS